MKLSAPARLVACVFCSHAAYPRLPREMISNTRGNILNFRSVQQPCHRSESGQSQGGVALRQRLASPGPHSVVA